MTSFHDYFVTFGYFEDKHSSVWDVFDDVTSTGRRLDEDVHGSIVELFPCFGVGF